VRILLLNDTRCDQNPGCQATVAALIRQLVSATGAAIATRSRGDGYGPFFEMVRRGEQHSAEAWQAAVDVLATDVGFTDALTSADLVVVNLEGTFHHQSLGALALGGALALAHRSGVRAWAVNGTVDAIDRWLIEAALGPCEHVAVREPRSVAFLAAHGVRATAAADCVFALEGFFQRAPSVDSRQRAALYTPGVRAVIDPGATIVEALADLEVLASTGGAPVFLQMEEGEAAVAAAVARRGWPVEHAAHVAWNCFGAYLRQFQLLVSGRYHLLIFAAMAGVPAVARPSNTFKIAGVLELLEGAVPLAASPSELRQHVRSDAALPIVDRAVIRKCQTLASRNVAPRVLAEDMPAVAIEGLDWAPAADLEVTLAGLALDGPPAFRTTLDVHATPVIEGSATPVRPLTEWQMLLSRAGLQGEPAMRRPDGGAVLRVTAQLRAATVVESPPPRPSAEAPAPVVFLVHDRADFDALRRNGAMRASWSFMVVTTAGPAIASAVAAWCRARGVVHAVAPTVRDLAWPSIPAGWRLVDRAGAFVISAARRALAVQLSGEHRSFRLALFGASSRGLDSAALFRHSPHVELVCFLDNDPGKRGTTLDDTPVHAPDASTLAGVDLIIISSMYQEAIAAQLIALDQGHKLLQDAGDVDALRSLQIDARGFVRCGGADVIHG